MTKKTKKKCFTIPPSQPLSCPHLKDPEVLADIGHPSAQACRRHTLAPDNLRTESGLRQVVAFHPFHQSGSHVVLVESQEGLEEGIQRLRRHPLLAGCPREVARGAGGGGGEHHAGSHNLHTKRGLMNIGVLVFRGGRESY